MYNFVVGIDNDDDVHQPDVIFDDVINVAGAADHFGVVIEAKFH